MLRRDSDKEMDVLPSLLWSVLFYSESYIIDVRIFVHVRVIGIMSLEQRGCRLD